MHIAAEPKTESKKTKLHRNFAQQETGHNLRNFQGKTSLGIGPHGAKFYSDSNDNPPDHP